MSKYPVCNCNLFISGYNPKCPIHGKDSIADEMRQLEREKFWDEMSKRIERGIKSLSSDKKENE